MAVVRGQLDRGAETPFGPDSIVRRVVAEPVTLLSIQRTLVMDVAHPAVAAAVEDHSHFRHAPWRRITVTLDAGVRLVFGDSAVARGAVRQIYRTHDRIEGRVHGWDGPPARSYTAHDASLLTWVWATLVDSTEVAYTRWVRPFSASEADDYYAEMSALARFLGIPEDLVPPDRAAFAAYLGAVLGGDVLWSSPLSRALAYQILWFRHHAVPAGLVRMGRALAFATFDPRLRRGLGLEPDAAAERLGRRLDPALARWYHRLPRAGVRGPQAYVALRRPFLAGAARRGPRHPERNEDRT